MQRYIPINVADIEDLAVDAVHAWVGPLEFNRNRSEAKVGCHREVGDSSDHSDTSSDVVEDALAPWLGEGKSNECKGCNGHDRADSPVPVATTNGDGDISGRSINGVACDCQLQTYANNVVSTYH